MDENYAYFLKMRSEAYLDEWVAIVKGSVAAHGKNVKEVYKKAKEAYPSLTPLIARIPSKHAMIF